MAKPPPLKRINNDRQENVQFDPSALEDDDDNTPATDAQLNGTSNQPLNSDEVRLVAKTMLGTEVPDDIRNAIVEESINIRITKDRIVELHMSIALSAVNILRHITRALERNNLPSPRLTQRAERLTYEFLERITGFSKANVVMYLREYHKFFRNPEAMRYLGATDMRVLLAKNKTEEMVKAVIDLRKDKPKASGKEVQDLLDRVKRAEQRISEQELEATILQERSESAEQLAREANDEKNRLQNENERAQAKIAQLKDKSESMVLELRNTTGKHTSLVREADAQRVEIAKLAGELSSLKANPLKIIEKVEVPPAGLVSMQETIRQKMSHLDSLDEQIIASNSKLENLRREQAEIDGELEKTRIIKDRMNSVLAKFSEFSAEYTAAQVLISGSSISPYRHFLEELSERLTKFADETRLAISQADH
ncbi:hypothetical protein [Robbsia andropogonis]|uniref:hypothetical protein n=1 Tax=Robbsia andropogonis TaxID=28092 RepID=UPI002A6AF6E4|nr:hypothetical protein [Robbsia andropogonis]